MADININAGMYQPLNALQDRYNKYLGNLETNTGHIMDTAGAKLRDAREGGKTSLQQGNTMRGVASSPNMANYEAQTQRGVQQTIGDITTERERTLGSALQGGLGIMRSPAELAMQEKGLGIQAYQASTAAQNAAAQQNLNAFLAMLNAQRSSPLYTGSGAGSGPFHTGSGTTY
jgi:hypothetical protein